MTGQLRDTEETAAGATAGLIFCTVFSTSILMSYYAAFTLSHAISQRHAVAAGIGMGLLIRWLTGFITTLLSLLVSILMYSNAHMMYKFYLPVSLLMGIAVITAGYALIARHFDKHLNL